MLFLKASTAGQEVLLGPFVDSTDGVTAETGLTIANTDIKIWKAGATTLANKNSGGATHISNGNYYAVLDATDTDTVGSGAIIVQVSGALAVRVNFCVLPALVYDSLIGGTDNLQVDAAQFGGTTYATALAAEVDAVLDEVVEGSTTMRQMLRVMFAVLAGKAAGLATTSVTFRDIADTKNRVSATVDANGNRTAITLDAT